MNGEKEPQMTQMGTDIQIRFIRAICEICGPKSGKAEA